MTNMPLSARLGLLALLLLTLATADAFAQETADRADAAAAADFADAADSPGQLPADAAAAKQQFDVAGQQWAAIVQEIREIDQQRRQADGPAREQLDAQLREARRQADQVLEQLVTTGLAAYLAAPDSLPSVSKTLLSIAQFRIAGNSEGDGGDQYEKALAIIQPMLQEGAGDQWPQLWTWGAVAAYCTNHFDLAEQYFGRANDSGALGVNPPSRDPTDPNFRIWQAAKNYEENLPTLQRAWQREQAIRAAEAEADDLPRVRFTTTRGDIVLELFENEAPESVANMITLVKQGFYDGVPFHRVLPGFMAQGGDPTGTGTGGPGYNIRDEHTKTNFRRHFRGSLSMANKGERAPNSGSSQFFLTFVPTSFLDGRHAVFGRVVEGMDVAASLKRRDPSGPPPHPEPDRILKAEVIRDRGHSYDFEKLPDT